MKFVITCGGTAGHINPGVAIANQLKEVEPSCEIVFIGASGNMEMDLVPREGYDIIPIRITNISRDLSLEGIRHNLATVQNVFSSTHEVRKILRGFSPDAVIGTGGYVCYPVLMAASQLGISTFIHESNAFPGLTTKLLASHVDRIFTGMESGKAAYSDPSKVIFTGTPVRKGFRAYSKESAREFLGLSPDELLVVSVMGSLGAGHVNQMLIEMIDTLCTTHAFHLVHVTGEKYYNSFMESLSTRCPDYQSSGIEIFPYVHDMPQMMCAADLVICRSGASTLSELCYTGKPAILIPSPNVTANHQEKNARVLENAGGAKVCLEESVNSGILLNEICDLLSDRQLLDWMSANMRSMSVDRSAELIVDKILSFVRG